MTITQGQETSQLWFKERGTRDKAQFGHTQNQITFKLIQTRVELNFAQLCCA